MIRIPIGLLSCAILAVIAPAQRGTEDGFEGKGGAPPKESGKPAAVQGAAPSQKGLAPARIQLGEPMQPTEIQTRDGARVQTDPRTKYRTAVKMMLNIDRAHRDRVARLERLREIFEAAGASDKLATVARLRELEQSRYEASLLGYARGMGASIFEQVRAVIDAGAGAWPYASPAGSNAAPADPSGRGPSSEAPSRGVRRERR